jgi:hypothetical protein
MFVLRGFLAVSFSLAFAASVLAAPNRPVVPRRPGVNPGIEGIVVQVHHDPANPSAGWIKLHRGFHRSRGQTMTVAVNPTTRFQRLGQRGRNNSFTIFRALHRGKRVRVFFAPAQKGIASVVEILPTSSNRLRNSYVSGYRHRSYYGRRHVYHRSLPVQQRVVVPIVKRSIQPMVKHEEKVRKPAAPRHIPSHPNHPRSSGHSHPSSHHRK